MRLGLIARGDNRGLGQQTWAYHRNLAPVKTMVVDCPSVKPLPLRLERFPDAQVVKGFPSTHDLERFLEGVDVVLTAECAYNNQLYPMASQRGVKTVLALNYEFLDRTAKPSLWAAPSLWHFDDIPGPKVHLPVPVEMERFTFRRRPEITPHFVHIIGRPAVVHGVERAGTLDLLRALRFVRQDMTVTIKCQEPGYVDNLVRQHRIHTPNNVVLRIDSGDVENYWDLYQDGDVMVLPRRWGGLSLPTNEAIAAGMPVLMPDISPNNLWLPKDWLFPAQHGGVFQAKQRIDYYKTDPVVLAAKLDEYAQRKPSSWQADVGRLQHELSWETLKPRYEEVLSGV